MYHGDEDDKQGNSEIGDKEGSQNNDGRLSV
jgi:hypothetical protein